MYGKRSKLEEGGFLLDSVTLVPTEYLHKRNSYLVIRVMHPNPSSASTKTAAETEVTPIITQAPPFTGLCG